MRRWLLALVLGLLLGAIPAGQTLSDQVLQLLTRNNTWTGTNIFGDLRISTGIPSVTTNRFYTDGSTLFWSGSAIGGGSSTTTPHNLLSTTHPDTLAASVVRGSLVVGNSTPKWAALVIGTAGMVLRSDGTDAGWSTNGSA